MAKTEPAYEDGDITADKLRRYRFLYEQGRPEISDAVFDRIEAAFRKTNPDHPYFTEVGSTPIGNASSRAVKLPTFMGSLSKVHAGGSLQAWLDKVAKLAADAGRDPKQVRIAITNKLDGVSVLAECSQSTNSKMRLYSRGDGTIGQDISHLRGVVRGTKHPMANGWMVRGEFVISRDALAQINDDRRKKRLPVFKSPRNLVAGVINSARVHEVAEHVQFIAHGEHSIITKDDPAKVAEYLSAAGWQFSPGMVYRLTSIDDDLLLDILERRKKKSPYDLDGLVLAPRGVDIEPVAFKGQDQVYRAVVSHVEWEASRHGLLKPTVELAKPLEIEGVNVYRATAHNARFVIENGIGSGAVIEIARANEVIPYISNVVKPASEAKTTASLPDKKKEVNWKWCPNEVDLLTVGESNMQIAKRLSFFLGALSIPGFKEKGLMSLVTDAGIKTPTMLATATPKTLANSDLSTARARDLASMLNDALRGPDHARVRPSLLMYGISIFPRGLGMTSIEKVLEVLGSHDEAVKKKPSEISKLLIRGGLGDRITSMVADYWSEYANAVTTIGYKAPPPQNKGSKLKGVTVVFTGLRLPDMQDLIESNGGKIANSVSKDTTFVVAANVNGGSTKLAKARALGKPVYNVSSAESELQSRLSTAKR